MSDNDHLANLSDGAGCAEVWEHLSEQRDSGASEAAEDDESDAETADAETTDANAADAEETDAEQEAAAVPCP